MRTLLTLALICCAAQSTAAQTSADSAALQLAMIQHVLEEVDESHFCLERASGASSYAMTRDSVEALPAPTPGQFQALQAATQERFGRHALPYCLTGHRTTGFESALDRLLTSRDEGEARRGEGRPWFGRSFFNFGPYGQPAVEIHLSAPLFEGPDAATIGVRYSRSSTGTSALRCQFRREQGQWILSGPCTGYDIRA